MVMDTLQIRLNHKFIKIIDNWVEEGIYSSRSDAIRDAVRKLALETLIGIMPNKGDSVKEIKKIRKKLSKEKIDLAEINRLGK